MNRESSARDYRNRFTPERLHAFRWVLVAAKKAITATGGEPVSQRVVKTAYKALLEKHPSAPMLSENTILEGLNYLSKWTYLRRHYQPGSGSTSTPGVVIRYTLTTYTDTGLVQGIDPP